MSKKGNPILTLGSLNIAGGKRQTEDFYATDPIALEKLLNHEVFNHFVWENACGNGSLSKVLEAHGYNVKNSDIIKRAELSNFEIIDFLEWNGVNTRDIITNPPYQCFSIDTECYTKRGWLYYTELEITDEILSVNPDTFELEWSKINELFSRPLKPNEKVYHFKQEHMDIICTESHRMVAFNKQTNKLQKRNGDLIKSQDIRSTHYIPRTGYNWKGKECSIFILPSIHGNKYAQPYFKQEIKIDMDKWLMFFGLWLADGYCRYTTNLNNNFRKTIGIKQSAANKEMVEAILNDLPFKYSKYYDKNKKSSCINFEIHNEQLWNYLKQFGKSADKYIPEEIKNLSVRQLNIFLDSYFKGDGIYINNGKLYSTISSKLITDIWELLLKTGYLAHVFNRNYTTSTGITKLLYSINYQPHTKKSKIYYPTNKNDACLCNYNNLVWCVNLEKNGCFFLRRNGQEFVSGNCVNEFLRHALDVSAEGTKICMILRLTFLEGQKRFEQIFKTDPPKKIYVFSKRILMAKDGVVPKGSAVAYAWYIWEKGWKGNPTIFWL